MKAVTTPENRAACTRCKRYISTRRRTSAKETYKNEEDVQAIAGALKHVSVEYLHFVVVYFPNSCIVINLVKQVIYLVFMLVVLRD
jgi:hypothetical protein